MTIDNLLDVHDLQTQFETKNGVNRAVDGVSFSLRRGESLGIVGESGCGKSVTALSVMNLLPRPACRVVGGSIVYSPVGASPVDIATLDPRGRAMRSVRGKHIAMVFQDPMSSLNPIVPVGRQISEAMRAHDGVGRKEANERAVELLDTVGIGAPRQRVREYPHEMSGGMRQRVMIAMAISCGPALLIADEPTTSLDVTLEAQIIDLIKRLRADTGMALAIITHDLGVIAELADRTVVMYMGRVVESGKSVEVFDRPAHPYTQGLLSSVPRIGRRTRISPIAGTTPDPFDLPKGCLFAPRCPHAMAVCREMSPPSFKVSDDRSAACWLLKPDAHA
ncbi:MAG: ABC transporter ATP-binding protein [Spirochaetaceae bacterium]|nr:MAG: ABC transporter ATP-binding protein [Spirochaetaceae bacterium]